MSVCLNKANERILCVCLQVGDDQVGHKSSGKRAEVEASGPSNGGNFVLQFRSFRLRYLDDRCWCCGTLLGFGQSCLTSLLFRCSLFHPSSLRRKSGLDLPEELLPL